MTRIENLHKRRKKLGLSLLRYFHAFMNGYGDKRTKNLCPYKEGHPLAKAYWEGRRTRHNYDKFNECHFSTKNILTFGR